VMRSRPGDADSCHHPTKHSRSQKLRLRAEPDWTNAADVNPFRERPTIL
jgi:hypothetical protein